MGVCLIGLHLIGVYLMNVYLIYEPSLCAGHGGENPCIDTNDVLKASDCGRLGHQAAGHPWSALRVVKSCRKDCPAAEVLLEQRSQHAGRAGRRAIAWPAALGIFRFFAK
jgi:hypothetical protein